MNKKLFLLLTLLALLLLADYYFQFFSGSFWRDHLFVFLKKALGRLR